MIAFGYHLVDSNYYLIDSSYHLYILIIFISVPVINSTRCSLASGSSYNLIDSSIYSIL